MRKLRVAPVLLVGLALLAPEGAWGEHVGSEERPGPAWGRGRLGVQVQPMTEALRAYFEAPRDRGVLVVKVEPESPAAAADVRVGDVVVAAGGQGVERPEDLIHVVAGAPADEKLVLEIVRDGKSRRIEVVPEGRPVPWRDPQAWEEFEGHMERSFDWGRRELRRRIEQLERRLRELERRLDADGPSGEERT